MNKSSRTGITTRSSHKFFFALLVIKPLKPYSNLDLAVDFQIRSDFMNVN